MLSCHDMKKDQVYVCESCGIELKVLKECKNAGIAEDQHDHECCNFVCCEKEMTLK